MQAYWASDWGGMGQVWRKKGGIHVSGFFLLYLCGKVAEGIVEDGKGSHSLLQTTSAPRDGGGFFEDTIKALMWGRVSQWCYMNGLMVPACCWFHCSRV